MTAPASSSGAWHVPAEVLRRYADPAGAAPLPAGRAAAVEAHLDTCTSCARALAPALPAADAALLAELGTALRARTTGAAQYRRPHNRVVRMTAGLPSAWLLAAVAVTAAAGALGVASQLAGSSRPPVLLLLAPLLPLLGVAAAWTPSLDPLHELTCSTPAAGLALLLRRTLVVLAAVVPLLAVAGAVGGAAPLAGWLLPCLALTACALALGGLVGLHRAAAGLAVAWALAVVVPALATREVPAAVQSAAAPAWLVVLVLASAGLWLGRRQYTTA